MTSRCASIRFVLVWAALGLLIAAPSFAEAQPRIERAVTDETGVLSVAAIAAIEARLVTHHEEGHAQIALLLVRTTGGVPIADYALQAAVAWGGGSRERDDGVLFVLALEDHEMRLEVGYGLEATITDATAARILEQLVAPLRAERFDAAAWIVSDELVARTGGAHLAPPASLATPVADPVGDAPLNTPEPDVETPEERAAREARVRAADARSEEATTYGILLAVFFVLATLVSVVLLTRGQATSYGADGQTKSGVRSTVIVTVGAAVALVLLAVMLLNGLGIVSYLLTFGVVLLASMIWGGAFEGWGSSSSGGSSGSSGSSEPWRSSSQSSHGSSSSGSSTFGGGGGGGGGHSHHGGGHSHHGGGGGFGGGGASKRW